VRSGRVSSLFGIRDDPITGITGFHNGVDIAAPLSTKVRAAQEGRVIEVALDDPIYGIYVLVEHARNFTTLYAHLQSASVEVGDRVTYTLQFTSRGPRADQLQVQDKSLTFQVNLAVRDLEASRVFYTATLDFKELIQIPGYVLLQRGSLMLGLKTDELLWYPDPGEYPSDSMTRGVGVELVLESSDVDQFYTRMQQADVHINESLKERPWGSTDFRMLDPDGYYWRVTSPRLAGDAEVNEESVS